MQRGEGREGEGNGRPTHKGMEVKGGRGGEEGEGRENDGRRGEGIWTGLHIREGGKGRGGKGNRERECSPVVTVPQDLGVLE